MVHTGTPQVDVGHQCMNTVTGEVAHTTPVIVGCRQNGILLSGFQIAQAIGKHRVRSHLRDVAALTAILKGLSNVWHITEVAYQVEIAQRT